MIWKLLKEVFTEGDNFTFDPVRVFGVIFAILSSTAFIVLASWSVLVLEQPFDYSGYGIGLASVWGVVSVAICGKAWLEKKKPEEEDHHG